VEKIKYECKSKPNSSISYAWIYFYCDFSKSNKQTVEGILLSLLTQLLYQSRDIPSAITQLYSQHQHERPSSSSLKHALKSILAAFSSVFLIVDALDECFGDERASLLKFVREINTAWVLEGLHLVVTSRPETDIEKALKSLHTNSYQIDLSQSEISTDIATYVESVLHEPGSSFSDWTEETKVLARDSLLQKANGMLVVEILL
jgi:hypothetical protein